MSVNSQGQQMLMLIWAPDVVTEHAMQATDAKQASWQHCSRQQLEAQKLYLTDFKRLVLVEVAWGRGHEQ
eukprot:1139990-Pelagomonas_calceolata.AAC.5